MRLRHVLRHDRSIDQSRTLVERAFADYAVRFAGNAPTLRWVDGRRAQIAFALSGEPIRGELVLHDGATEIALRVPLVLGVFKARAIRAAETEMERLLTETEG